jgi:hypothetical protein
VAPTPKNVIPVTRRFKLSGVACFDVAVRFDCDGFSSRGYNIIYVLLPDVTSPSKRKEKKVA